MRILLGNGAGGFADSQRWEVGDDPYDMVAGDFNGDLVPDLAVTNRLDDDISIRLGDGAGGFPDRLDWPVGGSPWRIVAGDFNGDQILDLAVLYLGGQYLQYVSTLLGDGAGGFGDRQDWLVGGIPLGVAAGDFNGDQDLDIAVPRVFTIDAVSILLGNGAGGFGAPQDWPVADHPEGGIITGDFSEDQVLDLAVTCRDADVVSVLLGDGAGGFPDRQDLPVVDWPRGIVGGDFNGDQDLDLAVTNYIGDPDVSIFLGDGAGGFGDRRDLPTGQLPMGIVSGDFNGDSYGNAFLTQDGDFTQLLISPDSTGYTRVYPDSSKVVFDIAGFQIATIDRNGNTTTYEYDEDEHLTTITCSGDLVTDLAYNNGLLETITDAAGRITEFEHDDDGNLIAITDPDGSRWGYEYALGGNHLLTAEIDPRGNRTTYEYDESGYVTRIIGPEGSSRDAPTNGFLVSDSYNTLNEAIAQGQGTPEIPATPVLPEDLINIFVNTHGDSTRILTNAYGRPTEKTDVLGRIWKHKYDDDGLMTKTIRPDGTIESITRSATGRVAARTDSTNGATTYYEYDPAFDQLTMMVNALGDTTRYELDERGNTIRIIDPLDHATQNAYDSRGLLTKTINALGDSLLYYHNDQGNLDSLRNELGFTTSYEYDDAGNRTATIDPQGNRTQFEYDPNGRMVKTIDPLGRETEYIYDSGLAGGGCCRTGGANDLLLALVNAAGDTTHFEYDEMGRRIATIDPLGNISRTEYDTEGRVTRNYDAEGRWISYEYDKVGNMIARSDSLDRTYAYEYDSRNRRTKEIQPDPLNYETTYIYDGVGNLTFLVNANGDSTAFTYDLLGQRLTETDPLLRTEEFHYNSLDLVDWSLSAKGDTTFFVYDDLGRLTAKTFPVGGVAYVYDAAGNATLIEDDDSRLVMTYDPNNRLETVTTGNPGNPLDLQPVTMIEYEYDESGQKVTMIDPELGQTGYRYDLNGGLDSLITPDAELFLYERDKLGRAVNLTRPNGTTTAYGYDASGQVFSIAHRNPVGLIDSLAYAYNEVGMVHLLENMAGLSVYEYDVTDQLAGATHTDPLLASPETYTYDPVGNRLSSHLSTGYTYDQANQIVADVQYDYAFDDTGNMIEKENRATLDRWEYDYDYENRLLAVRRYDLGVSPPSMEASFGYDGQGRRITKTFDGTVKVYVYDGANFVVEYDDLETLLASFVNGLQIDEPLVMTRATSNYYYHVDRLGSIIALTDDAGVTVQQSLYDGFGNLVASRSRDSHNPYAYTGREFLVDNSGGATQLYYYRARSYEPRLGQFTSEDPLGCGARSNLYSYVENNPVNAADPLGLFSCSIDPKQKTLDPQSKQHIERNRCNRCPRREPEEIEGCPGRWDLLGNQWKRDNPMTAFRFHCGWLGYRTYRGVTIRGSQCTYSPTGIFVDAGRCMGTYDYSTPRDPVSTLRHHQLDVVPHGSNPNYKPFLTTTY
ncbi:RHS repeat-associated core domain-containing protein [Candidatus Eisenbacteria bacterium]|uniref:RHS repeat-associated core domain-containing protein n=1 Tax=Eiseniibacteriota bacterium TaxID=2212470 RepID=A0ABV6YK81_UNCEI